MNDPTVRNPWEPFRDAWEKRRAENEIPEPVDDLRDLHDHLSALTWTDNERQGRHEDERRLPVDLREGRSDHEPG